MRVHLRLLVIDERSVTSMLDRLCFPILLGFANLHRLAVKVDVHAREALLDHHDICRLLGATPPIEGSPSLGPNHASPAQFQDAIAVSQICPLIFPGVES